MKVEHLTTEQIEAGLSDVLASPEDQGKLEAIVIRPETDQRELLEEVFLSPERGVEGDYWAAASFLRLPDEQPDPRVQVSLMNARILRLIARDDQRIGLAGDNLVTPILNGTGLGKNFNVAYAFGYLGTPFFGHSIASRS